jgi:AcrR family transcriptional regulator
MGCDQARRRQILEAAERLFRLHGPAKTTVADIAREAAIGIGSVYLEFPSKDAVVEALSTARHERVLGAMRAAAERTAGPCVARFRAVFDARAREFAAMAAEGDHGAELVHCAAAGVKSARARYLAEERRLVAELLACGVREGEFAVADVEVAAAVVLLAYASFSPPWLFQRCAQSADAELQAMHELVLRGLEARPPRA